MSKEFSSLCFLILVSVPLKSQEPDSLRKGIHQVENDYYSPFLAKDQKSAEKPASFPSKLLLSGTKKITKRIFGWHPYWASSTAYFSYDYNSLSHIAYFSYDVDTATGGYTSIHNWNSTPLIDYAHQRGTKVVLTVTSFGTSVNIKLLTDTIKQKFLINTIISLLKSRNGDGVNFDLESVSFSQRRNMVNFISRAVAIIKKELPSAEISMATPAVDWYGSWDLKALSELCDYIIVMGYDYYWSGSSTAGPVAPMAGENYNVVRTVNTYLESGVPPGKLILGVPWYGYDWPVTNATRKSPSVDKATARTFLACRMLEDSYRSVFDIETQVPWISYSNSSSWRQLWYENTRSLSEKYNLVKSRNLSGIGIWALSYEGDYKEVWSSINYAFSDTEAEMNQILNIYPNPANGKSKIEYSIANRGDVTLRILDLTGKERIVLINEVLEPGFYSRDFDSSQFGQGLYLCVLQTKKSICTRKIIIVR